MILLPFKSTNTQIKLLMIVITNKTAPQVSDIRISQLPEVQTSKVFNSKTQQQTCKVKLIWVNLLSVDSMFIKLYPKCKYPL